MTASPVGTALGAVRRLQRAARGASRITIVASLLAAALTGGALVARAGTNEARIGATAALGFFVVVVLLWAVVAWRRSKNVLGSLLRAVRRTDPRLAEEIERADALLTRTRADLVVHADQKAEERSRRTSMEFAELHLERKLTHIDLEAIRRRALRRALKLSIVSLVLAAGTTVAIGIEPFRVVEGLDVWAARGGRAPIALVYVDDLEVMIDTPRHTGAGRLGLTSLEDVAVPRGSIVTVRARPLVRQRALVLTDGRDEIGFVPDGQGFVVARWTVRASVNLRVAAKFGNVRIDQRDELSLESIPDEAPLVALKGAPETVKLVDKRSLTLAWEATDDHGLTEIAVVMRAGDAEERRSLSKPHTQTKQERGVFELSTQESFFKRSHVPIEVTVQARDNDGVFGAKWGVRPAFIVIPPIVGEPEARRHLALVRARDALVDLLAARLPNPKEPIPSNADEWQRVVDRDVKTEKASLAVVEKVLLESHGGVRVVGTTRRVISGQVRRLEAASKSFRDAPSEKTRDALLTTTEEVVLAVDSAVRGRGNTEAAKIALALALVAEDAQKSARDAQSETEAARGRERLAASLLILKPASLELAVLGELGADLGDLARSGTEKIARATENEDYPRAELAAQHLSERLKQPVFSIGGGGRPGVESGGGDGEGVSDGSASEAHELAEESAKALEELIRSHQAELDKVDRALEEATTKDERDALKKLAKEHAEALRDAVKDLPQSGPPNSAAEKAAKARQRVESMAAKLERGKVKDAISEGEEGLIRLKEAKDLAEKGEHVGDPAIETNATRASNRLEDVLLALKDAQRAIEEKAKERAKESIEKAGKSESELAKKAEKLKRQGEDGEMAMPDDQLERLQKATEAMREAGEALQKGDVEKGSTRQRDAQRLLEMSRDLPEDGRDPRDAPPEQKTPTDDSDGGKPSQEAEVPTADDHENPNAFRKRVMDGLSRSHDKRHKDAVRRYSEGLLR